MKFFLNLTIFLVFFIRVYSEEYPNKKYLLRTNSAAKVMGREDRKDGVHSGNRVLTRIYNHGAI